MKTTPSTAMNAMEASWDVVPSGLRSARFFKMSRTTSKVTTSNCFPIELENDSGIARMSS